MTAAFNRGRDSASYFGIEGTFMTTPSMTRIFPVNGSVEINPEQEELEVDDQSIEGHDYRTPVLGLQNGTVKWSQYMRPATAQLDTTTTAATSEIGLGLLCGFGGEFPASGTVNTGLTVASGSATSLVCSSGHGARASKGMILLPQVGNVTEPGRVVQIATDTLTLMPALSGSPSAATAFNCYNYYPTNVNTRSFTFQHALAADTSQQWTLNGCAMTGLEFVWELGKIPLITYTGAIGSFTGPSPQSISTAVASSAMASPWSMRSNQLILQPVATTTYPASFYTAKKVSIKVTTGMQHIVDVSGVEGKAGVFKNPAKLFAEINIEAYPDVNATVTTPDATWWAGRTPLQCFFRAAQGSGATKRWTGFDMQTGVMFGKPKLMIDPANPQAFGLTLHAQISTAVTSPTTTDEKQRTPLIVFSG